MGRAAGLDQVVHVALRGLFDGMSALALASLDSALHNPAGEAPPTVSAMRNTLPRVMLCAVLLSPGWAHGDETARSPTAAAAMRRAMRTAAPVAPRKTRAARPPRGRAADAARGRIRVVGACDAAQLAALAVRLGRLAAMEECVRRTNPGASAPAPALSRDAPRPSDLGIPEEAFDPELEVRPAPAADGRRGARGGRGG